MIKIKETNIAHWEEYTKPSGTPDKKFTIRVYDNTESSGAMDVQLTEDGPEPDAGLSARFGISSLPGTNDACPTIYINFDEDNLSAITIFKVGDKLFIRPEANDGIEETILPDGSRAIAIS